MIESREDVIDLIDEYIRTQHEWIIQFLVSDAEQWNVERQVLYSNGIVLGKFRERDENTMRILKEEVTDYALRQEIQLELKFNIEEDEKVVNKDRFKKKELENIRKQLRDLQLYSVAEWININCEWIKKDSIELTYSELRVLLYLYYVLENINYQIKDPYCNNIDKLAIEYDTVLDKHSQFYKYGILPIDDNRKIISMDPPRIYDESIDKTFFTKNVPLCLLQQISDMMSNGEIGEFAIRLNNEPGYDGRIDSVCLQEALERGKVFDFVNLGSYSVSKLYSNVYEDCMWVNIDPQNITFEELCEDFDSYKDMVVTQVVHLQYEMEDNIAYITHLDHEYIFYTMDEYTNRLGDVTQKGTAQTRMKSFKIDNAKIPFDSRINVIRKDERGSDLPPENEQFLCYVLECYFKHKDLLKEYFQKLT